MSDTLNEKAKYFPLANDKWYIVAADDDEPVHAPFNSLDDAQKVADSKTWDKETNGSGIKIKQGKSVRWRHDLKEAHELITPVITGTPEERIEALNLWTALVTTLKKMSELPSNKNKLALLRGARDQSECELDRVTNVVPVPAPVPMNVPAPVDSTAVPTPEVPVVASVSQEVEPDHYEQLDKVEDGLTRLQELAGIKNRPV